ncbi:AAA family ATPase [Bosea sp. FBZP-16]|uniref:AAA family ATPase n=1 Tax=Bosea sp. FBZP-16 TaxID=2065382 RepID=UPI000C30B05D|nr:AAA family ATPase [Bosea sp. FBZP-16]
MRLKCLDLTRYGKFTDHRIEFGERVEGQPDLHIVYGPNEAGKSTALAGFLDLLFGIETRSRFNFIHPYPTMRVGGTLELAGGPQQLVRIKRPQNSLLDARDQPITEGVLLGELGGIDRESYRTMFSLDDATLEAGGESILSSKGDLGQLLFSASAGLADLSKGLVDLKAEAEGFYKYRARSGKLSDLKARLVELKAERERVDTLASDYAQLIEARDRAAIQYEEAIGSRGRIQARMDEIQRHLNALPRLADLRGLRQRIAPLANLPDAPSGWAEELPQLQKDEIELGIRAQGLTEEIAELSGQLDAIVVDETALRLADKVERLADLRARHVTAEKDIPERRLQLREAELAIATILGRIERTGEIDPKRLVLGASVVGALRTLIETRSGIEAALKSAADELSEARRRLDEAQARLGKAGGDPQTGQGRETWMSLAATVAAARADDHAARRRLAERARDAARATLADRLRALQPWSGDVDELVDLPAPPVAEIQRWTLAIAEAQKRIEQHAGEVERLTTEQVRLTAELDALSGISGLVSDQEAASIRAIREQAWAAHRGTLDTASADGFEAALRRDDIVTSGRLGHVADVAKLHQVSQALAIAKAECHRAIELRDVATTALHGLQREIAAAVATTCPGLSDSISLPQFEAWLGRRDKALEARALVRAAESDLREAAADAVAVRDRLATALAAAGLPQGTDAGFEALLVAGQGAIDREVELKALRASVDERQRDLASRERDVEKATGAGRHWNASWTKACSACWLGEGGTAPTLATVREILAAITELGPVLEKKAGLVDRIGKMEKDQAAFRDEAEALANELGIVASSGDVLDLAQVIGAQIQQAHAERTRRATAAQNLEAARSRHRTLSETLAVHDRRKTEMTAFFSVPTLAEVSSKLSVIEKRAELAAQADAAERDILAALRLPAIDEAEAVLDLGDHTALEAELVELKARFDDQDQRSRDLFSVHSKALDRVEAVGGDGAVAKIEEEKRTLLLDIEDRALRYLRLKLGAAAAEQALRAYRDLHRSSMMARASEAFATISRGAYAGLAAQPEKDGEILIALGAGGGSKEAAELSKGTRFQLYLALRVAGYYEFVASRQPVPFIADDIMETFDDFRAEEAFRLFGEMALVGQVIYLTHHPHLCEMARRVCPGTMVHQLTAGVQQ